MSNKLIDIIDITKSYDENVILDKLNLYIRENEFLTLLGPSVLKSKNNPGFLLPLPLLSRKRSLLFLLRHNHPPRT